jgi:hypothetical protein
MRIEDADEAVLRAVEHDLLRVEVVETSLAKAMAALQPRTDDERGRRLRRELAKLDAEVGRLAQSAPSSPRSTWPGAAPATAVPASSTGSGGT